MKNNLISPLLVSLKIFY